MCFAILGKSKTDMLMDVCEKLDVPLCGCSYCSAQRDGENATPRQAPAPRQAQSSTPAAASQTSLEVVPYGSLDGATEDNLNGVVADMRRLSVMEDLASPEPEPEEVTHFFIMSLYCNVFAMSL